MSEPLAYLVHNMNTGERALNFHKQNMPLPWYETPLYAAPPAGNAAPDVAALTDEQCDAIGSKVTWIVDADEWRNRDRAMIRAGAAFRGLPDERDELRAEVAALQSQTLRQMAIIVRLGEAANR